MGGLGLLEPHTDLPQGSDIKTAGEYILCLSFYEVVLTAESFVHVVVNYCCTVCQPAPVPERLPQRTQVAGSPAVMLSPPRQRGHSQHIPRKSHTSDFISFLLCYVQSV